MMMAEKLPWLIVLVAAAVPLILLGRLRVLTPTGLTRCADPPQQLSVVIPARDEEATLPDLLTSLHNQPCRPQIIVIDDHSTDRTASVARTDGARVISAGDLPPGWTGKAWACHVGAEAATGQMLLFLDADTRLAPDALTALLNSYPPQGGLVSVQPYHRPGRPYENLSAYFNIVSVMASGSFTLHRTGAAMAFGPCMLISRTTYKKIDGHRGIRDAILDDARLAQEVQQSGLAVHNSIGGHLVWMRSYPGGLRQLLRGWAKNIAPGAAATSLPVALGTVLWLSGHHVVAVQALTTVARAVAAPAESEIGPLTFWAAAWAGYALQLRYLLHKVGAFRWWTWALFPASLLVFDLIFAASAVRSVLTGSVTWRERTVPLRTGRGNRSP